MNSKDFFPENFLEWEKQAPGMDVKKIYIDIAGDFTAGVLLSQIVYWHLPAKDGRTKLRVEWEGHLWIAKTKAQWWQETGITKTPFDRSCDILLLKKLIHYQVHAFGRPNVVYMRLDVEVFLNLLFTGPLLPFNETPEKPNWKPKNRRFVNP